MSVFGELKRRNVFRVGVAYVVTAWLVLQLVDVVGPILELPDWIAKAILLLLAVGLPLALLFAWAFELTPEGLKFERDIDPDQSVTRSTGRKLDFVIIGILAVAVIFFSLDKFVWNAPIEPEDTRRSIAVLPFANMSGDPEQVYFSDGITEEILNTLVRVPGISVASRTSSFKYRKDVPAIATIAEELGVLFVLEGSVRRAGDDLRITAQLIDGMTDRHLWSETYDRQLEDIFEIQSDIATRIVRAIQGEMGVSGTAEIETEPLTADMTAYELYLKGRRLFQQRLITEDAFNSVAALEQAVAEDPEFAEAWVYLAAAYIATTGWVNPDEIHTAYDRAEAAVDTALSLDPNLPFANAVKGAVVGYRAPYDLVAALRFYEKAIRQDPKDTTALYWMANLFTTAGYLDEALATSSVCLDIDPLYRNCLQLRWQIHVVLGEQELARADLTPLMVTFAKDPVAADVPTLLHAGNRYAAVLSATYVAGLENAPVELWLHALENPADDHSAAWREFRDWAADANIRLSTYPSILAAFGAFDEISFDQVYEAWPWLPVFAKFRASPEFKALMRKHGYHDLWKARGFPDMCRPVGADDFECE